MTPSAVPLDGRPFGTPEPRRRPRSALALRAMIHTLGHGPVLDCTTVNLGADGVCLRLPAAMAAAAPWLATRPNLLTLVLPGGVQTEPIEMVRVWERNGSEQALSGWRFTRVPAAVQQMLQGDAGPQVAGPPGRAGDEGDDGDDAVELWDYVNTLIRWRWLVCACMLVAGLAAVAYARLQPASFTAEARVFAGLSADVLDNLSTNVANRSPLAKPVPFVAVLQGTPVKRRMVGKTYAVLLPDSTTARRTLIDWAVFHGVDWDTAAAALAFARPLDTVGERAREAAAMGWLGSMTTLKQDPKDGILSITVEAEFPDLAAQVANNYVDELGAWQLQNSTGKTEQNLTVTRARMDTLQRDMAAIQRALEAFKVSNQNLLKNIDGFDLVLPEVRTRLDSLEREARLKEKLLITVSEQYELLRLQREKEATGIDVISPAEAPLHPAAKTVKYAVLGTAVGAFAGVFLAFLADYLQHKRAQGALQPWRHAVDEDLGRLRQLARLLTRRAAH